MEKEAKVDAVVKSCVECIITDSKAGRKEGLLNPIDKSDRPLLTYHLDHVGPMDNTKKLYNHILVIVDAFSKFVWLRPTKSTGSKEVVDKLQKQAAIFGNPVRVITDRGTAFTSKEFEEYCKKEDIQHLLIATGVPRGNGQVERVHRVVVPMLAKMCAEQPNNWYRYVDRVQQILNNTPSRSTQNTPFKILTGIDMRTREDFELKKICEKLAIEELQYERDQVRENARENILKIQMENKKTYGKNRIAAKQYDLGDLVVIKRTQYGSGMKLRPKFLGP